MAMDPEGKYLKQYLNIPGTTTATYRAVAANFEPPGGSPLLRIARDGATDVVFGKQQNDLVVPTDGVFTVAGLASFPIADPLLFDPPAGVDHSSFWDRREFADALRGWLA
jgi:hypothetical protein